jgi:hypothetical protein
MAKSRPRILEALRDAGFTLCTVSTPPLADPKNPRCTVIAEGYAGKVNCLAAAAEAINLTGQKPTEIRAFATSSGPCIIIEGLTPDVSMESANSPQPTA